jgi:drug/metabolite transporter (DMT)-like permease
LTPFALLLVLASAMLHATWNYLAKQAGGGGAAFVWLISVIGTVAALPLIAIIIITQHPVISDAQVLFLLISSLLHIGYYFLLNRGYKVGDLSLVYPLSRGTGPALATLGAVLVFGERPPFIAVIGTVLVTVGVFVLMGNPLKVRQSESFGAVAYGLLTGLIIALYTLSDKEVVDMLMVPPLLLIVVSSFVRSVALAPHARQHWDDVRDLWRKHRRETIGVAVLDPLSYTLFLTALAFSPVSYLAPTRQISILLGAALGTQLLAEGNARRRLIAAFVMLVGLMALALH